MCGFISSTSLDFFLLFLQIYLWIYRLNYCYFWQNLAARNETIHEKTLARSREKLGDEFSFPSSADEVTSGDISNLGLLRKMKDMRTPRRARTIASAAKFIAVSQSWGFFTTKKVPTNSCRASSHVTRPRLMKWGFRVCRFKLHRESCHLDDFGRTEVGHIFWGLIWNTQWKRRGLHIYYTTPTW